MRSPDAAADVLHLTPAYAARLYGAGHWKACQAVWLALRDIGLKAVSLVFDAEDGSDLPADIGDGICDVIVEYSRTPDLVAAIRRRYPRARVHVRAHNAEAWHHVHRSGGAMAALSSPRVLYGVCRLLARDSRCRRLSETVLSISNWDSRYYWSWLPGRARVIDVPYFSPWPDLRSEVTPRPWHDRESVVLCLPGARDPIGRSVAAGFYRVARSVSRWLVGWRFAVSAGLFASAQDEAPPPGIDYIQDLTEPWDLLCRVKAVAVLTSLGFGAKTTVFDALAAGCHVLVDSKLAMRLPMAARESCIGITDSDLTNARALAAALETEPPPQQVNSVLRAQAVDGLRRALATRGGP